MSDMFRLEIVASTRSHGWFHTGQNNSFRKMAARGAVNLWVECKFCNRQMTA